MGCSDWGSTILSNNPGPGNLGYHLDGKWFFFDLIVDNARERTFVESMLWKIEITIPTFENRWDTRCRLMIRTGVYPFILFCGYFHSLYACSHVTIVKSSHDFLNPYPKQSRPIRNIKYSFFTHLLKTQSLQVTKNDPNNLYTRKEKSK